MIPKVIHYCWFGGNPLPEDAVKCIESWKKICPDYEIRRWDETNYDITQNAYMKAAYDSRKWGFVPDYARLDIIYEYGGFYLDVDVELVKSLDELRMNNCYAGFESDLNNYPCVALGLGFGAIRQDPMLKLMRDAYEEYSFIKPDGELDLTPAPRLNTRVLEEYGLIRNDQEQSVGSMHIYPKEFFCPKDYFTGKLTITENTYSIHHYTATWLPEYAKRAMKIRYGLRKYIGVKAAGAVGGLYTLPYRVAAKYKQLGLKATFSFAWSKLKR